MRAWKTPGLPFTIRATALWITAHLRITGADAAAHRRHVAGWRRCAIPYSYGDGRDPSTCRAIPSARNRAATRYGQHGTHAAKAAQAILARPNSGGGAYRRG